MHREVLKPIHINVQFFDKTIYYVLIFVKNVGRNNLKGEKNVIYTASIFYWILTI